MAIAIFSADLKYYQCDIYALSLHVRRLPYVEATILELLRYKTLVPLGAPHCTLKDTEVGGYFIPRGTWVSRDIHM